MARKTGRLEHETKYKQIQNKVVSTLRKKQSNNLKPNSEEFWRAVKVVQKQKSSIPTLSGNITDDKEKLMFLMHISQNVSIQQFHRYVLTTSLAAILMSAQKNSCAVRRRYLHSCNCSYEWYSQLCYPLYFLAP